MARTKIVRSFRVTIPIVGARVALSATDIFTQSFSVYALAANTNNVYVGDAGVDNTYQPIDNGDFKFYYIFNETDNWWNLTDFYVDTDTAGNIIIVEYEAYAD